MYKNVTKETNHFISSYVVYILENLTEINFKINDIGLGWSYHFRPGQASIYGLRVNPTYSLKWGLTTPTYKLGKVRLRPLLKLIGKIVHITLRSIITRTQDYTTSLIA